MSIESIKKNDIHQIEHYEGNYTLVFQERISHPVVRERLVDNLYEHFITLSSADYEWTGSYVRTPRQIANLRNKITREKINQQIDRVIENVFNRTEVRLNQTDHDVAFGGFNFPGTLFVNSNFEEGGFSIKQKSMFESHEKGHGVRDFSGESEFTKKVLKGFDFSHVSNSAKEKYITLVNEKRALAGLSPQNDFDTIEYFKRTDELIERMSQLKNYFGMKGLEIFTKDHLNYIRKNYIQDMGFPAQIEIFLEAISPETENEFLNLMNTLGI